MVVGQHHFRKPPYEVFLWWSSDGKSTPVNSSGTDLPVPYIFGTLGSHLPINRRLDPWCKFIGKCKIRERYSYQDELLEWCEISQMPLVPIFLAKVWGMPQQQKIPQHPPRPNDGFIFVFLKTAVFRVDVFWVSQCFTSFEHPPCCQLLI